MRIDACKAVAGAQDPNFVKKVENKYSREKYATGKIQKKQQQKNPKSAAHVRFGYPCAAAAGALDPTYICKVERKTSR